MEERFDLYDQAGHLLGRSKARHLVHRDGDWHRSIALWIVRPDGRLVFQRRSNDKDTWPGRLTGSVTGHYAAGEALADVLREAREEIGLEARLDDLLPIGLWRNDDAPATGVRDRELQDVFLWPLTVPLLDMRPDPAEVAGLAEIAPPDLLGLLNGTMPSVPARYARVGADAVLDVLLGLDDFVPAHTHYAAVARAALAYVAGTVPRLDP